MMSRWFALRRTSSSNGKSHSKRTIRVCTSLKTLVTLSKPIIQPISWSSTASCNGRVLVRLSILSTDGMAMLFLNLNASVPITIQWFLNFYFQGLLGQLSESLLSKHSTCVSKTYSQLQPKIGRLPTSLYSPPGKLSEFSLSKHLTCAFRTRSQPQPVEIFSMLISRQVVGVFTVQTPHLCLQDLLPTSACRDIPSISKHVISGNQLTSHFQQMTLQPTCQNVKQNKHHLNQEYSSSSMPLTLHQQCTNLVSTADP